MTNKIFKYPIIIKEHHLDTFGHVNNAMYLALLEEARWELITQNGYGMDVIQKTGLGPTILNINIKFMKEIRLRQLVIIETQLDSYRKKIGVLQQRMLVNEDVCCSAEFVFGLFSVKERKLVSPTEEWLKAVMGN